MSRNMTDKEQSGAAPNLAALLSWRRAAWRWGAAVGSGLLLSLAFPPVEWHGLAWVALLPLLFAPLPARRGARLAVGWLFGLAHFVTSLAWLNEIGFAAGVGLALVCAVFPMLWLLYAMALVERLGAPGGGGPGGRRCVDGGDTAWRAGALTLLLPAGWVALEWVRGWIATGFPWNQLGVSQWQRLALLPLSTVTGVYGLSFLIVAVNVALALTLAGWWRHFSQGRHRPFPAALALAALLLAVARVPGLRTPLLGAPDRVLRVLAVQGDIPQIRQWTQEEMDMAVEVYDRLTRQGVAASRPDLVVWPETAIPASLRWDQQYSDMMRSLLAEIRTPCLIGTIDHRETRRRVVTDDGIVDETDTRSFNSAFLLDAEGHLLDWYDKVHLVPFGEYTPFERLWPWLTTLIGMGRSLTAGSEHTVLRLPKDVPAGVNICYEDAFPRLSREFVRRGATVLATLTNDAWYAESAGARQHLTHAVFRAVENRRPLLRSGNNSDTCLILPDGRLVGLLRDPLTGRAFVRGSRVYEVPVWDNLGHTFYTLHGDVFAHACAAFAALTALTLGGAAFRDRARRRAAITGGIAA